MRVSVIIPTYNSAPLVVEAVESVLAQTRPADEIIVVDDGSTDNTTERLSRFGSRIRVISKENGGVSSARNRGVAEAEGDLIAFLDADDVWHPMKLELQIAVLQTYPELGMLGTGTFEWPCCMHPKVEAAPTIAPIPVPLENLIVKNAFAASSVIVRRCVLREVEGFDINQSGTEDYDLWLRIAQRRKIANLSLKLTGYRETTPGSLSKNAARMEAGMELILNKTETAGLFRGRRILRRKAWAYCRYSCGLMYRDSGFLFSAISRFIRSLMIWPLSLHEYRDEQSHRSSTLLVTLKKLIIGSK